MIAAAGRYTRLALGMAVAAIACTGCRHAETLESTSYKPSTLLGGPTEALPYHIGVGDVLEISPREGDPIRVRVGLHGAIHYHEEIVDCDGLTREQLEAELDAIAPCRVQVAECSSKVIHVSGVFREEAPRTVPFRGPETLENLIDRVGCRECSGGYRVRVVRTGKHVGDPPEVFSLDFNDRGRDRDRWSEPIRLEAGDHVYFENNIGYKGPLTLLTDRRFLSKPISWTKRFRLAQADQEIERLK